MWRTQQRARWRRLWLVVAALQYGAVTSDAAPARTKPERAVGLTVSVFNDAEVEPFVLKTARERAEAVFEQAGISLTWLDCGTPGHRAADIGCSNLGFPTHLSVRLLKSGSQDSADAFGNSILDERGEGNYAFVYLIPLASSPVLDRVNEGDLLGYVVAHELGHLLLGPNSHSATGLMRGVWEYHEVQQAARGSLLFDPSQTERMRSRFLTAIAKRGATQPVSAHAGK